MSGVRYGGDHEWIVRFDELDRTGTNIDRRELNQAHVSAIKDYADIIADDLASPSRSATEELKLLAGLDEEDIQVLCATDDFDPSTPDVELSLTLFRTRSCGRARAMSSA